MTIEIVTLDSPMGSILRKKTAEILDREFHTVQEIEEKLHTALKPHLPAAGLAAPQIGINKSVFIYSYDRDPKHFETVINPSFVPEEERTNEEWEGCFSLILSDPPWKLARVARYERIRATYIDQKGQHVEKILKGFAAKVFQHEYDHLQGILNTDRRNAVVKKFTDKKELLDFLQIVKKLDSCHYSGTSSK